MKEVRIALRLAKKCFPCFNAVDIALMFLTLKNRKLKNTCHGGQAKTGNLSQVISAVFTDCTNSGHSPSAHYGPAEVGRYQGLLRRVEAAKKETRGLFTEEGILGRVFECADEQMHHSQEGSGSHMPRIQAHAYI